MVGGMLLAPVFAGLHVAALLATTYAPGLGVSPCGIPIATVPACIARACITDSIPVLRIAVPVFPPTAGNPGSDTLASAIPGILAAETGRLTPRFGPRILAPKPALRDAPTRAGEIARAPIAC